MSVNRFGGRRSGFRSRGTDFLGEQIDILNHKNFRDTLRTFAEDVQGVDEISRKWLRGHAGITAYFRQIEPVIEDIRTEINDVHERVWGDVGLMTCWVEQDYTLEGKAQHISSPTTVVLRRDGPQWRIVLFHAIPLPGE